MSTPAPTSAADDAKARTRMRYFCATHEPIEWRLPEFMEPIASVPAGEQVADLSERVPELRGRGPELSEYATLFALRRILQDSWREHGTPPEDEMIGLGHYRRFTVTRPTGRPASVIYGAVTPEEFVALPHDLFLPPPGVLMHPMPIEYGIPVVTDYGNAHHVRDLLRFMAVAIDLGVVSETAVGEFLGADRMIPVPTMGVYPVTWLVGVLETLERVVDAFEKSYAVAREGYQRRAIGFCSERLHALLLFDLLRTWPEDRVVAHRGLLISSEDEYRPNVA